MPQNSQLKYSAMPHELRGFKLYLTVISVVKDYAYDGVTPRRGIRLILKSNQPKYLEQVCHILQKNSINATLKSDAIHLHLFQYTKICETLKNQSLSLTDQVPPSVLKHLSYVTSEKLNAQRVPEAKIEVLMPYLWSKLHDFQRISCRFGIWMKRIFLADDMGCGKTLQALTIATYFHKQKQYQTLIVCPALLKYTWSAQIQKWIGQNTCVPVSSLVHVVENVRQLTSTQMIARFVVISYSLMTRVIDTLSTHKFETVILDESHYIKNRTSKRSKAALKLSKGADVRILISGTPFSYPRELFTQLKFLYPTIYPTFFGYSFKKNNATDFANRYCVPKRKQFGNRITWEFNGYDRQKELHCLLNTMMIRRTKDAILPFLPEKLRHHIVLPGLKKREALEIKTLLSRKEETFSQTYMEAHRKTCTYKLNNTLKYLQEFYVNSGRLAREKIVIFYHYDNTRVAIGKLLLSSNIPFFEIYGKTKKADRTECESTFNNTDKYRVALLSISAACTGLTLTAASIVVFAELMFGPETVLQAEDRCHRIGQTCTVHVQYLMCPASTDNINWNLIAKKLRESGQILGDINARLTTVGDQKKKLLKVERGSSSSSSVLGKRKRA